MDIDKLKENRKKYILKRAKEGYRLARSLGFDSYQSASMAGWSKDKIRKAAEQKDSQ